MCPGGFENCGLRPSQPTLVAQTVSALGVGLTHRDGAWGLPRVLSKTFPREMEAERQPTFNGGDTGTLRNVLHRASEQIVSGLVRTQTTCAPGMARPSPLQEQRRMAAYVRARHTPAHQGHRSLGCPKLSSGPRKSSCHRT